MEVDAVAAPVQATAVTLSAEQLAQLKALLRPGLDDNAAEFLTAAMPADAVTEVVETEAAAPPLVKLSITLNTAGAAVLRIKVLDSEMADEPAPVEMAEVSAMDIEMETEAEIIEVAPATVDLMNTSVGSFASFAASVQGEESMCVTDAPVEDLSKLTVPKLKVRLKELGAPVNGKKADLIERLTGLLVVEAVSPEASSVVEEHVDMESVEAALADISIIETEQPDAAEEEVDEPQPAEEMPAAADEPSGRWKVSIVFGATGRPALTIKRRERRQQMSLLPLRRRRPQFT